MPKQKPLGRSSRVLFRFTVSYLLLMLIPLAMGVSAYLIALNNASRQVQMAEAAALERAASEIECSLTEAKAFVSTLSNLSAVTELYDKGLSVSQQILALREAIANLPEFRDTYRMFQRYLLYIPSSGVLLDNRNAYIRLSDYYSSAFQYGDLTVEAFQKEILEDNSALGLHPVTTNIYQRKHYRSMLYVCLFVSPGRKLGRVVFYMDEEAIIQRLQASNGMKANFVGVFDAGGRALLASDKSLENRVFEAIPKDGRSGAFDLSHPACLISYYYSDLMQATLVVSIPNAYISGQLTGIRTAMVGGMSLLLAIGLLCAFALMQSNRRPLAAVIEKLPSCENTNNASGLWWMEEAVSNLMDSNEELERSMEAQRHELQNAAFHLIVSSGGKNENELESLLNYVGIHMEGDWFCGVYIQLSSDDQWNHGMTPRGDIRRMMLMNILAEFQPALIFMGLRNQNTCAMVYVGQDEEPLDERVFRRLYQKLIDAGETNTLISVGPKHRRLTTLFHSFTVAEQQLDQSSLGKWLLVAERVNGAGSYHYSARDEQKLCNMVANAKQADIGAVLDHLWYENFEKRNVVGLERELLYYRMLDTLIRVGGDFDTHSEEQHPLSQMSAACFFQMMREKFALACQQMEEKRLQSSSRLLSDVFAYLMEHYMDYDTCLASTALHFGLTEKYFSAFFKEKAGVNFSSWLEDVRIRRADELLLSSQQTIEEIAKAVGYSSAKSFDRAYYRCKGQTPSQARRQAQAANN